MSKLEPLGIRRRGLENLRALLVDIGRKAEDATTQMLALDLPGDAIDVIREVAGQECRT